MTRAEDPAGATAVITLVRGRHEHLAAQQAGLRRQGEHLRVLVSLGDPEVAGAPGDAVVRLDVGADDPLPLAAGRNAGAARALALGATTLVFLDVDCLAGPGLVTVYAAAVADAPGTLWSGPVTYLTAADRPYPADPAGLTGLDAPHPARPAPGPGEHLVQDDWPLFWSLSFALSASAWAATGGFDEAYDGYGGEDTDFGQRARVAGLRLGWLGDARAYHQHHPTQSPPVQHLHDVLRNARTFRDRWGWWPMTGWLEAFAAQGLAHHDVAGDDWRAA